MLIGAAATAATTAATTGAQATDARRSPSTIRVQVADSLGVPVEGAEVSIVRGLKGTLASARSDVSGNVSFIVDLDSADYSVVARKPGYSRGDRFFAAERNVVDARVTMKAIARDQLSPVTVTAVDLKRKSYFIDADDIGGSSVHVHDALDIVHRLRPDMLISRSGNWGGRMRTGCSAMTDVWVNGRRYMGAFVIVDEGVRQRVKGTGNRLARVGMGTLTILSQIEPEHISEMTYHDCFDTTVRGVGTQNAVFITLKPGVDYRPGGRSYVVGEADAGAVSGVKAK
jgi:hypothetical protein